MNDSMGPFDMFGRNVDFSSSLTADTPFDGVAEVPIQLENTDAQLIPPGYAPVLDIGGDVTLIPIRADVGEILPSEMGTTEATDSVIIDTSKLDEGVVSIPSVIDYESLPKFPGSLNHGLDFDGRTWETLGGSESHVVVDLSGDSEPDIIGIDFDGDKVTDIALRLLDTDGDTIFDTIGVDSDQDGRFDFFQSIL